MLPFLTGYGWNAGANRYVDLATGRFVSQDLIDSRISLADWQNGMMVNIKQAHTAAAALSNGGWANMSQSDWGATGQMIREQYGYLRNFAEQIANGTQALDGRLMVRTDMYADAAYGTFSRMRTRQ